MKKILILMAVVCMFSVVPNASEAASITKIGNTKEKLSQIFFSPNGRLFGYETKTKSIFEVDPRTGVTTLVTKVDTDKNLIGFTFSPNGNLFALDSESNVYWIQLTGSAKAVDSIEQQFDDLAISMSGIILGYEPKEQQLYKISLSIRRE